jgi:hypothetical protein
MAFPKVPRPNLLPGFVTVEEALSSLASPEADAILFMDAYGRYKDETRTLVSVPTGDEAGFSGPARVWTEPMVATHNAYDEAVQPIILTEFLSDPRKFKS